MRQREILNAAKEQAGMTQKEFAKYFGIPLRTVEGWFTEKREIPDYLLRLMLYRLEIEHKVSSKVQRKNKAVQDKSNCKETSCSPSRYSETECDISRHLPCG